MNLEWNRHTNKDIYVCTPCEEGPNENSVYIAPFHSEQIGPWERRQRQEHVSDLVEAARHGYEGAELRQIGLLRLGRDFWCWGSGFASKDGAYLLFVFVTGNILAS